MEWSKHILLPIQEKIGIAVMNQLFNLPVNLFLEWHGWGFYLGWGRVIDWENFSMGAIAYN
jgi:hypothetical protein